MNRMYILLLLLVLTFSPALVLAGTVNINTADAQTLAAALQGVGAQRAEAIVAYREANGGFEAVEDLLQVQGIGEATLRANRERLSVE